MESRRTTWLMGLSVAAIVLLASCDTLAAFRLRFWRPRSGPPAHAPAHGYRNKVVHGHTLVFDPGGGLYIVLGLTDCYYHEGHFYRLRGGVWEISLRADTWTLVGYDKLPAPVQFKAKSLGKLNGNGKSGSPVKPDGAGNGTVKSEANGDVKPSATVSSAGKADVGVGDTTPNATSGSPAKPLGVSNTKPNAVGSIDAKSNIHGESPAKPGGSSPKPRPVGGSGGTRPRGVGKGRR